MSTLRLDPRGPARAEPAGLPRVLAGLGPDGARLTLARHLDVHGPLPRLAAGADRRCRRAERPARPRRRRLPHRDQAPSGRRPPPLGRGRQRVRDRARESEGPPAARRRSRISCSTAPSSPLTWSGRPGSSSACRASAELVSALEAAIRERGDCPVEFAIAAGGGGYVSGEESAVVNFIETGRTLPRFTPPAGLRAWGRSPPDADRQPGDAGADGARRAARTGVVPPARHRGRSRLGPGDDRRRRRAPGRLRARLRHLDAGPAPRRRRRRRTAPGAARRRLFRHLDHALARASSCASPGPSCARPAARWGRGCCSPSARARVACTSRPG